MSVPGRATSLVRRVGRLILVLVVALVVAVGALLGSITVGAFPQRSGTIALGKGADGFGTVGLGANVTVRRDANGIAWIEASTAHDLFYAQGFIHAQDRLWQMEVLRRIASGRTSELFGAKQEGTDAFIRTLGWRGAAEADWTVASPEVKSALTAYADGVNAFIAAKGGPGFGFVISGILSGAGIGYRPDRWTPIDSLGYAKLQAWNLGGNLSTEIWRLLVDARLGDPAKTDALFPPYRDGERPLIAAEEGMTGSVDRAPSGSGSVSSPTLSPAAAAGLRSIATTASGLLALAGLSGGSAMASDKGIGSNNWAVAPSQSTSGSALLANDPHLGYSNPPIWYVNGLRCVPVGPDCPYEVAGVSFPGVPGVVLGHNAQAAWAVTNVGPDVQDLYRLATTDADHYRDLDGTVKAFGTREEKICFSLACKDGDSKTITVRTTTEGAVISDVDDRLATEGAVYALRWTATDTPETLLDAFFRVSRATSIPEFRDALRTYGTPSQNFVYAGPDGIAYQTPGRIPVRASAGALGLRPSVDASGAWTGTIPFEQLPRLVNPPSGFIVTANNAVVAHDDPRYLGWEFDSGDRAARILDDLKTAAASGGVSLDELAAIQNDTRPWRVDAIRGALALDRTGFADGPRKALADAIVNWDGRCEVDSTGCSAYAALELRLLTDLVGDELGDLGKDWIGGTDSWVFLEARLTESTPSAWWDDVRTKDVVETRNDVILRAVDGAVADLAAANGGPGIPAWGQIHTIRFEEQTLGASGIAPIEAPFDLGPFPAPGIGGAPDNLNGDPGAAIKAVLAAADPGAADATRIDLAAAFAVLTGPSYRLAVDVGNWDAGRIVVPTGQTGTFLDAHDGDLVARFLGGELVPFPFSVDAVRKVATETLTLTP